MGEDLIKTGVDELLDLLKYSSKIPLSEAAQKLKVSLDVIQAWVDFLVEESIVGIEYKFTTPYIYLNKSLETKTEELQIPDDSSVNIFYYKKQFWEKAKKNNIPSSKIDVLWKNHLLAELELKKKYFFFEAQTRKIKDIEGLWKNYEGTLLSG
jgi:hypothetical protein